MSTLYSKEVNLFQISCPYRKRVKNYLRRLVTVVVEVDVLVVVEGAQ